MSQILILLHVKVKPQPVQPPQQLKGQGHPVMVVQQVKGQRVQVEVKGQPVQGSPLQQGLVLQHRRLVQVVC